MKWKRPVNKINKTDEKYQQLSLDLFKKNKVKSNVMKKNEQKTWDELSSFIIAPKIELTGKQKENLRLRDKIVTYLVTLDKNAFRKRKNTEFINIPNSNMVVGKLKSIYTVHNKNNLSKILLKGTDKRDQVEKFLYNRLKN